MTIKKKHILRIMLFFILLVTGSIYFFVQSYKKQDQVTIVHTPDHITIPFKYGPGGHILIDIKIDNSGKKYPFVLDTGASNYLFDSFPEEKIGKSIGRGIGQDINGKLFFPKIFNIPFLEISGIQLKNIAFSKSPSKFNCTKNTYGVIGKNVMRHFAWQFDFQNQLIHIAKEARFLTNPAKESIQIKLGTNQYSHHLYIPLHLNNGQKTKLTLDTGKSIALSLSPKVMEALNIIKKTNILGEGSRGLGGKSNSRQYLIQLQQLYLGQNKELPLPKITAKVSEKSSFKGLGLEFLKNFTTTIDWKNKTLILQQKTSDLELIAKGFGITLGFEEELYIKSVIEGSKAHALGIQPNMKRFLVNDLQIKSAAEFCSFRYIKKRLDSLKLTFLDTNKEYTLLQESYSY